MTWNDIRLGQVTEESEYFSSNVAFEAADGFRFCLSLLRATFEICPGSLVMSEPDNHDSIDGGIRLAVATTIQTVPIGFA